MAVQTYMSRIFRAPLSESGEDTVIYVNFGWNTQNNQAFPDYNPVVMAEWMPKEQYEQMCAEIKQYLSKNGMGGMTIIMILFIVSAMCLLLPLICICPWICSKKNRINKDVQEIIKKYSPNSALIMPEMANPTPHDPSRMGIDTNGVGCISQGSRRRRGGPIWPPLGYNIVYRLSGRAVANAFRLGAPVGAPAGAAQQQIGVAVNPVAVASMVTVTVPPGVGGGSALNITAPDGRVMTVTVPMGLQPGQSFNVNIPPAVTAVVQVAPATQPVAEITVIDVPAVTCVSQVAPAPAPQPVAEVTVATATAL